LQILRTYLKETQRFRFEGPDATKAFRDLELVLNRVVRNVRSSEPMNQRLVHSRLRRLPTKELGTRQIHPPVASDALNLEVEVQLVSRHRSSAPLASMRQLIHRAILEP